MKSRAFNHLLRWSCAMLLAAPAAALAAEDIDSTHPLAADGLVEVENVAGSIEFTAWDRDEVRIRGRVADDVEEVEIESTANGLRIEVRNKRNQRQIDATHLRLMVPAAARIEAQGVSADILVRGSRGDSLALTTVSGDVEVEATAGRVELASVSGDVSFEGSAERTTAESVSGEVTLIGVDGEVEASTVSGDVVLEAGLVDSGRFETVSGDLSLMLELADGGRLNSDAMSGDINLRLPASQQGSFSAQSYSGSISSEFGDPKRHSKSSSGSILKAEVGDDSARIRLETFSGDISIRSR
jgi:DUF4097 and DUF4098 domain-containing protein YvlB